MANVQLLMVSLPVKDVGISHLFPGTCVVWPYRKKQRNRGTNITQITSSKLNLELDSDCQVICVTVWSKHLS